MLSACGLSIEARTEEGSGQNEGGGDNMARLKGLIHARILQNAENPIDYMYRSRDTTRDTHASSPDLRV